MNCRYYTICMKVITRRTADTRMNSNCLYFFLHNIWFFDSKTFAFIFGLLLQQMFYFFSLFTGILLRNCVHLCVAFTSFWINKSRNNTQNRTIVMFLRLLAKIHCIINVKNGAFLSSCHFILRFLFWSSTKLLGSEYCICIKAMVLCKHLWNKTFLKQ